MKTKYPDTTTDVLGRAHDMRIAITPHVAAHVLWYFGAGGYEPGSYISQLLELIARADPVNTAILRSAYPEYVHAFQLAQSRGGIGELQKVVNGDADDRELL